MQAIVWSADYTPTQPYGPTDLSVEPFWGPAACHWHCGIDIPTNIGTPLYAARNGRVVYVGYGLLAIMANDNSIDWFVHIDRSNVPVNATVTKHQLVAYSGNKVPSGGSLTGPHLHFEVQAPGGGLNIPGDSINPISVLTLGVTGGKSAMATLDDIWGLLNAVNVTTLGRIESEIKTLQASVDAVNATTLGRIEAEILKIPTTASAGSVDLSGVLAAIADAKSAITTAIAAESADVSEIKSRVDKSLQS